MSQPTSSSNQVLDVNPSDSALILMDYQNSIISMVGDANAQSELINRANKVLEAARHAHLKVIYVMVAFREGHPEISPTNKLFSAAKARLAMLEGSEGASLHKDLKRLANEPVVVKRRMSALCNTDLGTLLSGMSVRHLVFGGVSTSGCILSTVRQAADQDYQITVLEDLCADMDSAAHSVLIKNILPMHSTVIKAEQLCHHLHNLSSPDAARAATS